jgi:hypothetical protein
MAYSTARARLRSALSARLVPAILSAGFEGPRSIDGNKLLHEYRRRASSCGTQVLGIQFEKRQRPRFVLNLHVEPSDGLEKLISNGGTLVSGRLKAKAGALTTSWFRADRPWWQRVILQRRDTLEDAAVAHCLSLLPEVEGWWETHASSAHIKSWPITYPGARGP